MYPERTPSGGESSFTQVPPMQGGQFGPPPLPGRCPVCGLYRSLPEPALQSTGESPQSIVWRDAPTGPRGRGLLRYCVVKSLPQDIKESPAKGLALRGGPRQGQECKGREREEEKEERSQLEHQSKPWWQTLVLAKKERERKEVRRKEQRGTGASIGSSGRQGGGCRSKATRGHRGVRGRGGRGIRDPAGARGGIQAPACQEEAPEPDPPLPGAGGRWGQAYRLRREAEEADWEWRRSHKGYANKGRKKRERHGRLERQHQGN